MFACGVVCGEYNIRTISINNGQKKFDLVKRGVLTLVGGVCVLFVVRFCFVLLKKNKKIKIILCKLFW